MAVRVELVSPEGTIYSGEATMVIARTLGGGDIAFMEGHAPFVGALEIATATIATQDGEEQVAVHGGFVEVTNEPVGSADAGGAGSGATGVSSAAAAAEEGTPTSETVVTILSDVAELARDIDVNRARQAKERAEQAVRRESDAEAESALRRAHVRLAVAAEPV